MGIRWTQDQQKVIDLRNRNILVSAAAGSGKTAVLVERIIERITKENPPLDVDQFLILTFTEAAASEMKERIGEAVEKKLEEEPNNEHLKKQSVLVRTAKITTIHSFCLSVIREYFHTIDLEPGFRIGEEGELKLIRKEAMGELLESHYEEKNPDFLRFVEQFAPGKDDKELEKIIELLYEFSGSNPQPEKWLDACVEQYRMGLGDETLSVTYLMDVVKLTLEAIQSDIEKALAICQEPTGPFMYEDAVKSDQEKIERLQKATSYEALCQAFAELGDWKKLAANRKKEVDKELAEYVKQVRQEWQKEIQTMQKKFFFQNRNEMQKDLETCIPVMEMLVQLVKEFRQLFSEKKMERNLIDFDDMEQFAIRILTKEENGRLIPSETARELAEQFEEIMIDEYQDSNLIQETILTSVSRMDRGEYNIFMVGDVKQSIYRFRLSRPELFMEKYHTYSTEEGTCQRIDLCQNFRSREEVVDVVNHIFRKIMKTQVGGIAYDEKAALYPGAEYKKLEGNKAEILLIDTETDEERMGKIVTSREMEAKGIAERIHKLMKEHRVWDKEISGFRPIQYRDIVILTRSLKGWSDVFVKVLKQEGIPAYADSRTGYFGTLEIGWLLDYLKVLDNYRQDLPLASVLKSPFGQCTNEELAIIREAYPEAAFHEAVFEVAGYKNMLEEEAVEIPNTLRRKLKEIFEGLQKFRERVSYTAIHDLIWEIIEETEFAVRIAAMPGGEQRQANVFFLLEKAKDFERTSYKGLFHFIRYIEQIKEYDIDYGEADIFGENTNAVRVMSIHKSKGLEFPVVIVAGMGKKFNMQDTSGDLILHPDLGMGMDALDLKKRTKTPVLLKNLIQHRIMVENMGEELRILYVALTRAKEKLILTGTMRNAEEKLDKYQSMISENQEMSFLDLIRARQYFDWVIPALQGIAGKELVDFHVVSFEESVLGEMEREEKDAFDKTLVLEAIGKGEAPFTKTDVAFAEHLKEQFEYRYSEEGREPLKLKYTVSELKEQSISADSEWERGENLFPEAEPVVPKFLQEEQPVTGASRGSAYHKVMELLDFEKVYEEQTLEEELEALYQAGYLSAEMKACIRRKDILDFLKTNVGGRMQKAALQRRLRREQPFVFGIDATEIHPEAQTDDLVLIQGIIDAYFEEEDGLVVVDYKTDQVRSGRELEEKYREQLHLYSRALEQITQKRVKEQVIYSFTLGKEIRL